MRWPGACVSAAKEACQPDLAPPDPRPPLAAAAHRSQPPPTPDPRSPPGRAGASARRHRAAVRCGTNGERPSTDARSPAHASDATSTSTRQRSRITTSLTHLIATSATLAIAHPRPLLLPPPRPRPRLPPWLPSLVLSVLILMLVLVPITLAAAPPPAYHLHAWASLPGVCLAGRGRGSSASAVDPLPRKPTREAESGPEAGRRPVRFLRRTPRGEHAETNIKKRTGKRTAEFDARPS